MITGSELYNQLKDITIGAGTCMYTQNTCERLAPIINDINELKKQKNAVILAHTYVTPEIIYGVADYVGDSYGLSLQAQNTDAEIIVFSAVKFMGETAKILNPQKKVLLPNRLNGCTLADSIDAEQVRQLKKQYPDYAFICYINTSAEVKAECDVCVTSSNVYKIVENYPNDKIFFLPDKLMGENLKTEMNARGIKKDIKVFDGVCYVHEKYEPEMIQYLKLYHPEIKILAHPECKPEVIELSDVVGSTTQMLDYVKNSGESTFLLLTECGLTSRLQAEAPEKLFIGSCTLCKYMKDNHLEDILRVLKNPESDDIIAIDSDVAKRAEASIQKMIEMTSA